MKKFILLTVAIIMCAAYMHSQTITIVTTKMDVMNGTATNITLDTVVFNMTSITSPSEKLSQTFNSPKSISVPFTSIYRLYINNICYEILGDVYNDLTERQKAVKYFLAIQSKANRNVERQQKKKVQNVHQEVLYANDTLINTAMAGSIPLDTNSTISNSSLSYEQFYDYVERRKEAPLFDWQYREQFLQKGYHGSVSWETNYGFYREGWTPLVFNTVQGYQVNNMLFVGGGISVMPWYERLKMPIYADAKIYLPWRFEARHTFFEVQLGIMPVFEFDRTYNSKTQNYGKLELSDSRGELHFSIGAGHAWSILSKYAIGVKTAFIVNGYQETSGYGNNKTRDFNLTTLGIQTGLIFEY